MAANDYGQFMDQLVERIRPSAEVEWQKFTSGVSWSSLEKEIAAIAYKHGYEAGAALAVAYLATQGDIPK